MSTALTRHLRDPLAWACTALLLLIFGMAHAKGVFSVLFPELDRPLYEQDSFASLALAHLGLVALASALATGLGVLAGVFATRPAGREFRPMLESVASIGQTIPPVAVLAIAAPIVGFGEAPALIALALYGLLPILHATLAGLESVPAAEREAAIGLGMTRGQVLWRLELPLAATVIMAGVRTSVVINIGTAAIASTVGARSLGSPIIIGLSGYNTAYIIQGALILGTLAVVVDLALARLAQRWDRWRPAVATS
ncbi:ABC transporter permease [Chitinimonas naiadis]